jgi:peptide/nickel transport system ATP-binding protein
MGEPLVQIKNLKKYFTVATDLFGRPTSVLKAVDDVSFEIHKGEAFGLVGESGCGKTTIGRTLVNLYKPTGGSILFDGKDLTAMDDKARRTVCRDIQLIFRTLTPR